MRKMKKNQLVKMCSGISMVLTVGMQLLSCGISKEPPLQATNRAKDVKVQKVSGMTADEKFIDGYGNFGIELFKKTWNSSADKNVLVSPLSVELALAMTANGADGETKKQMETTLAKGLLIEELNQYLYDYCENQSKEQLKIANSIWIREDKELAQMEESFLEKAVSFYDASIYEAPFDNQTVTDINRWVEHKTDGMIEEVINEINETARLYLINALCFEGEWEDAYETNQIHDGTFTNIKDEKQTVSMMYSQENYYLESENATGFIKHYKGRNYSFVALLPEEGMELEEYIQSLDGLELQEMLKNAEGKSVDVAIPKFEYDYSVLMKDILKEMGMEQAFDLQKADFSKMGTSNPDGLHIGEVIHKTYVKVDELGTKAGAATVVEMEDGSAMIDFEEVILDRPFVYMIMDNEANLPVFIGTVTDFEMK